MFLTKPSARQHSLLFWAGVLAIFLGSLALRFWGLERFNSFVFDEVYYVKFASKYLTWTPFFDGHPPLSKYMLAIAMWFGENVLFTNPEIPRNTLAGISLSPLSYRWLNALLGSFIPLVVMGIAYQISHRRSYTLIAGALIAMDGLFLVESRYALNNIHLVLLGLLGIWFLLLAIASRTHRASAWRYLWSRRSGFLFLSGVTFGACASIKWNGLWFLLGVYTLWSYLVLSYWWTKFRQKRNTALHSSPPAAIVLRNMSTLRLPELLLYLGAVPCLIYSLIWIPHLKLDTTFGFWEVQWQILNYHQRVGGNIPSVHPYCSAWYTWPWMLRHVLYVYDTGKILQPAGPFAPAQEVPIIYDVHAMGNPILWWASTAALLGITWLLAQQWLSRVPLFPVAGIDRGILIFVGANYIANLAPWMEVSRCTFIYHYMGALVFAILGLAWMIDRGLRNDRLWLRWLSLTVLLLTALAFLFWMPLYLGLPLSTEALQARRWLPTW